MVWSTVSACTAAAQNYSQLAAIRFLLGLTEAPYFPGILYCLSCWYTRRELAVRIASLYTASCLANAASGLIAAGVLSGMQGTLGLRSWQWLFIIEAATGFFFGILGFFLIPDYPNSKTGASTYWLTEDERKVAAARIAADRVSEPKAMGTVFEGLKLVLTDIKVWVFSLLGITMSWAHAFNYFYPSIVAGFGIGGRIQTILLTAPPFFLTAFLGVLLAWSSDRRKERAFHIAVPLGVTVIGYIISAATLNNAARYFASFLYIGGTFSCNPLLTTWGAITLGRTPEKRAAAIAFVNVIGFVGNLTSPFFFPEDHAPRYLMAMIIKGAFAMVTASLVMFMRWLLIRENRKLKETADQEGTVYVPFMI